MKKIFYLKIIRWVSLFIILGIIGFCNYFCCNYVYLIKILDVICVVLLFIYLLFKTEKGGDLLSFIRSSYVELRQVIWPTRRETMQVTLMVAAVTMLMSLILWGLDSVLVHVITWVLRL